MLIQSLKFSLNNLVSFAKFSSVYIALLFIISFITDYVRVILGEANQSASLVLTLIEVILIYFTYAILIKSIFNFKGGGSNQGVLKQIGIKFFIYLRVNIIYTIAFFLGTMLLVIPGILALMFFFFAPILVIQKDLTQESYFKESVRLVKKAPWSVLFISLLSMTVMSLDFAIMPLLKNSGYEVSGLFFTTGVVVLVDVFLLIAGVHLLESTQK